MLRHQLEDLLQHDLLFDPHLLLPHDLLFALHLLPQDLLFAQHLLLALTFCREMLHRPLDLLCETFHRPLDLLCEAFHHPLDLHLLLHLLHVPHVLLHFLQSKRQHRVYLYPHLLTFQHLFLRPRNLSCLRLLKMIIQQLKNNLTKKIRGLQRIRVNLEGILRRKKNNQVRHFLKRLTRLLYFLRLK